MLWCLFVDSPCLLSSICTIRDELFRRQKCHMWLRWIRFTWYFYFPTARLLLSCVGSGGSVSFSLRVVCLSWYWLTAGKYTKPSLWGLTLDWLSLESEWQSDCQRRTVGLGTKKCFSRAFRVVTPRHDANAVLILAKGTIVCIYRPVFQLSLMKQKSHLDAKYVRWLLLSTVFASENKIQATF